MGVYSNLNSRTKNSRARKGQGFTYLDTKVEQFEREKKKTSKLKSALTEKNTEVRQLMKELKKADEYIKELEVAVEVRDNRITELENTVKVQRGIIEDLS